MMITKDAAIYDQDQNMLMPVGNERKTRYRKVTVEGCKSKKLIKGLDEQ